MNILELKRKLLPMSGFLGGGSSGSTSGTTTTGLPDWAKGYAQDTLAKQSALSERPYEAYNAPRIQGFTPMQETARQGAESMTTSPLSGQAAGIAGNIAERAQGSYYAPGQFNAQQVNAPGLQDYQMQAASPVSAERVGTPTMQAATTGYTPQLEQYQMGPAERVGTQSFTQPGSAEAYMSPYMQNVVEMQKREARRQSGIQGTQQQAQAAQAGAFGGSRDAIMRAERERNLAQQMGDIQATGSQSAFQQAQQQFNAEQGARLQAQQANQQAGLTTGGQNLAAQLGVQQLGAQTGTQMALANLSNQQQAAVQNQAAQLQAQGMNAQQALQSALANQQAGLTTGAQNLAARLGTQQFGAGQNLQAQLANQNYGLQAQQLAEQSRQFGAGQGMQGMQMGLSAAGQLGGLGAQQFQQGMDINQLRSAYGAQQQAMGQAGLSQAYQDYIAQREYPQQQLSNMASMMRGMPIGSTTSYTGTTNPGSPSFGQQLGSLGSAAWGLKQFFAEGGSVDSQQNIESIVSKLSDQQLDQAEQAAKARGDAEQLQAIQMEKAARASMQRGIGAAPVDMDNMLPTEQSMARGGIVAFAYGGKSGDPERDVGPSYDEDDEVTDAPAQGPGNQAIYEDALRQQLGYNKQLAGLQPSSYTPEQRQADFRRIRAELQEGAGPSPYEEERANIKRMQGESAQNLKYGKGLAALQASAAMLQGPSLVGGLASGASAFGSAYGDAIKADQAQKLALQNRQFNLLDAERKEKMGLNREAREAVNAAQKNQQDADKFKIDKIKALGVMAGKTAVSARPGAAAKPPTPPKVAEQAVQSAVATRMAREKPKQGETPEMMKDRITSEESNRVLGLLQQRFQTSVSDVGATRAGLMGGTLDLQTAKAVTEAVEKAKKNVAFTSEYMNAKPEARKQMLADAEARARAEFPKAPVAPTAVPPTAAPAAKPMPAAEFNAKWATLKSGQKLVGPDGIEYTKK